MTKVGRHDPCPCASGLKYKKCCLNAPQQAFENTTPNSQSEWVYLPGTKLQVMRGVMWHGKRFRVIWNRLFWCDPQKTFHDFLTDSVIPQTLSPNWFGRQRKLPHDEQHVLLAWYKEKSRLVKVHQGQRHCGIVASGAAQALISFAYDLYCLWAINKLPRFLIHRLRDRLTFQSTRYEVAVAAYFARAGYEITFLDNLVRSQKHCEFIAKHKETDIEIYVEAKSRRRPGVLHEGGEFNAETNIKGDIFGLFFDAVKQAPSGKAFLIFVDLNLPHDAVMQGAEPQFLLDIKARLRDRIEKLRDDRTPETALYLTNYAYYYSGERPAPVPGQFICLPSPRPVVPLPNHLHEEIMFNGIASSTNIPREI